MKKLKNISMLMLLTGVIAFSCAQPKESGEHDYTVTLKETSGKIVSDKLLGFNTVYAKNPDSLWESGVLADAIASVRPAFLRYPGGTVTTYFHWKSPSGNGWMDSWDPEYDTSQDLPSSEFMDLDEYMELVKKTGALPMLGVNVNSGFIWDRVEEGIQEALDMMQYCKDKGFEVEYWYLGNEPYMHDCNGGANTVAQYAEMINTFAPRLKEFDPNIKLIANWHATFRKHGKQYDELFALAGRHIDVVDIHWYNMWGTASWEEWQKTTPNGVFLGDSYLSEISMFREIAERNGYPDVKLASLEWNVGPGKRNTGPKLNAHQSALIQSEMMIQFMLGGLDMATFWPLFWDSEFGFRSFFDKATGKPQPNAEVFAKFGEYQGAALIDADMSPGNGKILHLAVEDKERNMVRLCVLNKNDYPVTVRLNSDAVGRTGKSGYTQFAISSDLQVLEKSTGAAKKNESIALAPFSVTFMEYKKR